MLSEAWRNGRTITAVTDGGFIQPSDKRTPFDPDNMQGGDRATGAVVTCGWAVAPTDSSIGAGNNFGCTGGGSELELLPWLLDWTGAEGSGAGRVEHWMDNQAVVKALNSRNSKPARNLRALFSLQTALGGGGV